MRNLRRITCSIVKPAIDKNIPRRDDALICCDIMISEPTTRATMAKSHGILHAVVRLDLFLAPSILQITLHNTIDHMIQVSLTRDYL
jgi:hypothetical protein